MGVPTFYTRLLHNPALSKETTSHMRLFVSGSAPLLAETHREWFARTGHAVLERYGMTETNMNTSNPYDGERVPGAVGHPLPGVSVRVTDPETGKDLGRETIGMIEVKGPNVFKGYWRMPEKTKAEFRDDGFFITGDLGKIDDKGYVHILGRGKDLVISGGFNVYPKEIESEIDAMPGVVESAVIGVPHADFGEGVTAVVVRQPGAKIDEAARSCTDSRDGWPNSRCRSASSSLMICRATPWARCRRTSCAIPTPIFTRSNSPRAAAPKHLQSSRRLSARAHNFYCPFSRLITKRPPTMKR